jgi:NADH-quinone oxidoreductase subunit N
VYFILVYVFSNLAAFGVVSVIATATNRESLEDYHGLYTTNPVLSWIMLIAMFSLAGIPPFAGFFGKMFLFSAIAEKGMTLLLVIATLNATFSLYYYLIVVKAMFIQKSETPIPTLKYSFSTSAGLAICLAAIVVIGFLGFIFNSIYELSS